MKRNFSFFAIGAVLVSIFCLPGHVFAVEIVLKKGRVMEAKVIEITDKDVKMDVEGVELTYALDEIKSINGMDDISKNKIDELVKLGHKYVDEATMGPTRDEEKCTEGINIFKKINELNLDYVNARLMIGITEQCKRHTESLPYILKELKTAPEDAQVLMQLGNVYRHDDTKKAEAIAEYEKAIKIQGPTPENQFEMGVTYVIYEEWEKALSYFNKALAMNPSYNEDVAGRYKCIGLCYLRLNRPQEAIAVFEAGLQKCPTMKEKYGSFYHGLSLAYQALGQPEKAAEYESEAKKYGPYHLP